MSTPSRRSRAFVLQGRAGTKNTPDGRTDSIRFGSVAASKSGAHLSVRPENSRSAPETAFPWVGKAAGEQQAARPGREKGGGSICDDKIVCSRGARISAQTRFGLSHGFVATWSLGGVRQLRKGPGTGPRSHSRHSCLIHSHVEFLAPMVHNCEWSAYERFFPSPSAARP